jgi:hypothetical protein
MFRILFLNIQCLRNKFNLVESSLHNSKIHCINYSEHWLNSSECESALIHPYKAVSFFARSSHKHGGVIQFLKSDILNSYKNLQWIKELSKEIDCELCGIYIPNYK